MHQKATKAKRIYRTKVWHTQPGEVTPENGVPFLFSSTVDSKTKAKLESRAFWDSHRNRGK